MSCSSCAGCFTSTDGSTDKTSKKEQHNGSVRFQSLLDLASSNQHQQLDNDTHDHVIPTIMSELSKNIYSSQTVLFQAYEELSLNDFLLLAKELYQSNIIGAHIAWANEHCQGNTKKLLDVLSNYNENNQEREMLLQYCNDQAETHEMFQNVSVGRVGVK